VIVSSRDAGVKVPLRAVIVSRYRRSARRAGSHPGDHSRPKDAVVSDLMPGK
jgi:hypothetical protein